MVNYPIFSLNCHVLNFQMLFFNIYLSSKNSRTIYQKRVTFCNLWNRSSHRNDYLGFLELFSIIYHAHSVRSSVQNVVFRMYLFQKILLHNNVFITLVLNVVRQFRHKYGHSKGHNNEFIMLVLHMSRKFHHKYVQLKVGKSMFYFIRQISYVSTIHFPFNQSYFHYYLLLWLLLSSYRFYRISIFDQILFLFFTLTNKNLILFMQYHLFTRI